MYFIVGECGVCKESQENKHKNGFEVNEFVVGIKENLQLILQGWEATSCYRVL